MMNVFIIPAWYPSKNNPIAGIFFKEQASYISELNDSINVGISIWGQNNADFTINKNPISIFKTLYNLAKNKHKTKATPLRSNLYELFTPSLIPGWPFNLLGENISGMINANLANFKAFQEEVGTVDIIHAHVSFPAGYIAMNIAKLYNIPYVITEHMGPFPFEKFLLGDGAIHPKLASPLENAEKVIAVSPKLADDITKFGFQQPIFIPNVINEDFFRPADTQVNAAFQFFTLAMLYPEKGIDDLLEAIRIVIKSKKEVLFSIGGGGQLLQHYKTKSKELGLEEHVEWLGEISRSEARDMYQKCHAFVLPSHGETFGVVYAEAIACGKPVIATKCGGPECIVDEVNGLLAEVHNPHDLAQKIFYLMENYSAFDSNQIRKGFEAKFSKRAVIPQITDIYNSLIEQHKVNTAINHKR